MPLLRRLVEPLRATSIWSGRGKRPSSPISARVSPSCLRPDKIRSSSLSSTSTRHACACDANAAIFGHHTELGDGHRTQHDEWHRRQLQQAAVALQQQQLSQQLRRHDFAHEPNLISHARRRTRSPVPPVAQISTENVHTPPQHGLGKHGSVPQ
ncbi:hypothetical protein CF319_g8248 [Tilletia indica]|nr:hypothetical protein CF319_g8248 [Tilletia indica]